MLFECRQISFVCSPVYLEGFRSKNGLTRMKRGREERKEEGIKKEREEVRERKEGDGGR